MQKSYQLAAEKTPPSRIDTAALVAAYLSDKEADWSPDTVRTVGYALLRLEEHLAGAPPTAARITEHLDALPVSPRTRQGAHRAIGAWVAWGVNRGELPDDTLPPARLIGRSVAERLAEHAAATSGSMAGVPVLLQATWTDR